MIWLKTIFTTVGMVCTAVCLSAVVVAVAWLIGYHGPDRVLQIVSPLLAIAALLSLLSLHFIPKR